MIVAAALMSQPASAKDWALDVPVNVQGQLSGKSIVVYPVAQYKPYYVIENGRIKFETPSMCAKTSSNTKYCRSELKQNTGRWELSTTNETLKAYNIIVEKLPCGTRTVIGQIHGKDDELVRLYADNSSSQCGNIDMYFINDIAYGTGKETKFYLKDSSGIPITLKLGEQFSYVITPSTSKINVSVTYNGIKYSAKDKINPFWLNEKAFYYKAGNYYQTTKPDMRAVVSFGKIQ